MRNQLTITAALLGILVVFSANANANGISIDAGLTPGQDRWILRTQVRYMQRKADTSQKGRKMNTYKFPLVLAYGVRPDLMLMLRQTVTHKEMSIAGNTSRDKGVEDLFILAKYKAYRLNTAEFIFGIAPTIGLEFPTGNAPFSSKTWDLYTGLIFSARSGPWGVDSNIEYTWNDFADQGKDGIAPGDELSLNLAFSHQFSLDEKASYALAPVLESTYKQVGVNKRDGKNLPNTGESVLYISPGIKFTTSSLILEALIQIPVWQAQEGSQLERDINTLVGVRFMF